MLCLVYVILLWLLICLPDILYIIIEHEKKNSLTNYFCNSFIDRKRFFMSNSLKNTELEGKLQMERIISPKLYFALHTIIILILIFRVLSRIN